ncbi:MAG: VWA domain-containing protein [Verrucomicrobiae bacterium]|nr:VWA domain-containing protein [Verrucomicrobiae bacterium]
MSTGLIFLVIALARPLGNEKEVLIEKPGIDAIIALDLSKSMEAEDAVIERGIITNRLSAAKYAIKRILQTPSNHRYGLVAFSGESFMIAPVTLDHGSIIRSAEALKTSSISKPGTDIAAAIKKASEVFDPKKKSAKAIVLITDGEQLQGDAVIAAREAAGVNNIKIFTVGVGTTVGSKIPERSKGRFQYAKNELGTEIVSKLNENVMKQIASAGGGYYMRLGNEGEGLLDIVERGFKTIPADIQTRKSKDRIELFQIPLMIALCIFLIEPLINERNKQTTHNAERKNAQNINTH